MWRDEGSLLEYHHKAWGPDWMIRQCQRHETIHASPNLTPQCVEVSVSHSMDANGLLHSKVH